MKIRESNEKLAQRTMQTRKNPPSFLSETTSYRRINQMGYCSNPKTRTKKKIIKQYEGFCHHCRKVKNKKNLVFWKNRDWKLSFCSLCIKKNGYKLCPVCKNQCKCNICARSIIEEDLERMEYLIKVSQDPSLIPECKEELRYWDKKKIIKQNNWAICSFNSNVPMNNSNNYENKDQNAQNWEVLELGNGKLMNYNNIPTLDFKFNSSSLNKIGSKDHKSAFMHYNEDSTEEFDEKVLPMPIVLPLCKEIKSKLSNERNKNTYSTTFKISRNAKKIVIKISEEGSAIKNNNKSNSPFNRKIINGPFHITRELK